MGTQVATLHDVSDEGRRYVTMNLRLMKWLRDKLGEWAERNHRSVTAEIVYRLERSIRADERKADRDR